MDALDSAREEVLRERLQTLESGFHPGLNKSGRIVLILYAPFVWAPILLAGRYSTSGISLRMQALALAGGALISLLMLFSLGNAVGNLFFDEFRKYREERAELLQKIAELERKGGVS